jgi:hypothetical protein
LSIRAAEIRVYFAGPDLVASVLLGGKSPVIEKAIRLKPYGKHTGLQAVALSDTIPVDPKSQDFFKSIIEQRKLLKSSSIHSFSCPSETARFLPQGSRE